ncbi:hypothetical protein EXW30_16615 [Bacillus mycoides]|nr:hypothetical protein EXW30_16615 [Bacillus mycoides]
MGGYKILYKTWYWPVFVLRLVYIWFIFGLYSVYIWFIFGLYLVYIWFIFGLYSVYVWFSFGLCLVSLIAKSVTKVTKAIFVIKIDLYYGGEHEKMSLGGDGKFW